jgi:hypothetical protein
MANQKQTLEVVRNIIVEIDKEISSKQKVIKMIETHPDYQNEWQEQLLLDWHSNLETLERLKHFVIYKA